MRLFALLALVAISCSGPSKGAGAQTPSGAGGGGSRGGDDAGPRGEPASDAPLTEEECERFLDHVIDIEVERMRKALTEAGRPETEMPSPEQIHAIREKMKEEETEACLAQPRADWRCGMEAETRAEVEACTPAD